MKLRKRLAALAASAIVTLTAGITVALSSHPATATPKIERPAAVAISDPNEISAIKKAQTAYLLTAEAVRPTTYTVKSGDTLAKIAAQYSSAGNWPALWYTNKLTAPNPNAISVGQILQLPVTWDVPAWMLKQALAAIPGAIVTVSVTTPGTTTPTPAPAVVVPTGSLQAYALGLLGGNQTQFSCLNSIIMRESGWRYNAANPSGAFGIPQALPGSKMAAAGPDWATNGDTQLRWMIQIYIPGRYGTACNAWAYWQAHGSY